MGNSTGAPFIVIEDKLGADRRGQHSIAINDQWRICFRFVDGDAYEADDPRG